MQLFIVNKKNVKTVSYRPISGKKHRKVVDNLLFLDECCILVLGEENGKGI